MECPVNALKHGIFANVALLRDEPRLEFDSILNGLREDLRPEGTVEETLVEKLAILLWRYRRLILAEADEIRQRFFKLANLAARHSLPRC